MGIRVSRVPRSNLFLSETPTTFLVLFYSSGYSRCIINVIIVVIIFYYMYSRTKSPGPNRLRRRRHCGGPPSVSLGVVASVRRLWGIVFRAVFFFFLNYFQISFFVCFFCFFFSFDTIFHCFTSS